MSGVSVIAAGPAHAEILAVLHAATIGAEDGGAASGAWSGAWVARILALPGASAALALASAPVGFALALPAGEAMDILAIGVLPEMRRRGIGRRLLDHCAERARAAGALRLMLEAAEDNAAALAFYRSAGFRAAARRPGYYRARAGRAARAALVLAKSL